MVHRPARAIRPPADPSPRAVEAPPTLPEGKAASSLMMMLPAVGVTGSMSMMLFTRGSGFVLIGALVLVLALAAGAMLMLSQRGQALRKRRQQRERYLDYLQELREELAEREKTERAQARLLNPSAEALVELVRDPARLWERRRLDRDFLAVRVGVGTMPAQALDLPDQGTALNPTDPFMLAEARAVLRRFRHAPGMPLVVPLDRAGDVSIVGPRDAVLATAQAIITQAAACHAPEDLALAVAHSADREPDWRWVKWLPHVLDADTRDRPAPVRRIASSVDSLRMLLHGELSNRAAYATELRRGVSDRRGIALLHRLLVVHDTYGGVASGLNLADLDVSAADLGVSVLHLVADRLQEPDDVAVRITVGGRDITVEDLRGAATVYSGQIDPVSPGLAEGLARTLSPLRLSPESIEETPHAGAVDVPTLLGIDEPTALDTRRLWADRGARAFLRTPIGLDDAGAPLYLDLKESADLGMGPHGLCVGATGSGKSELLRTLVLSLAATHPPEQLAMALIDYKGGATFAPFEDLPHVAGVITNLEDDAGLIERAYASLDGEVKRRQQVLREAGHVAKIADYAVLREQRPELAPLPYLLVIIDEFGELLTARPDFIELFLTIGRIGRSIGVHLLLSSQRIEGGKLKGLDAYLSYRLGLRTFSEAESRTVLETPDAFHLPPLPGFGYLKVDTTIYQRFKAAYVSGRLRAPEDRASAAEADNQPLVAPYEQYNAPATAPEDTSVMAERVVGETLLSVMVGQLAAAASRVHQIWLPPIPVALTLDQVAGPADLRAGGYRLQLAPGAMRVPLGLIDDPARQRQGPWVLDLTEAGGHLAIIGGPQSGKTTLLRTLVASLALTHTPHDVAVYGIDLVGSGLTALAGFPHVGGVAGRTDRERIRRTIEEVRMMLEHREHLCRQAGVDSVEQLRAAHREGELSGLASADVVLVIDGFGAVRSDFEDLEPLLADILQRGGGFGVHVVASMLRWNDVRIALQATFGSRVELRLGDPTDSSIGRRLAETIRADRPGRALTTAQLFAQVALPRTDGQATPADSGEALVKLAASVRNAWPGEPAPPIRVLPHQIPATSLFNQFNQPGVLPIAVDEIALRPVLLDLFRVDQHLIVLGDTGCGKSNLLRMIARGLSERHSAEEVVFAVMDPRGILKQLAPQEFVGGYASNVKACTALAAGVAKELVRRIPEEPSAAIGATPAGTVATGSDPVDSGPVPAADAVPAPGGNPPHVVVLIDDYDMMTAGGSHPLEPLLPFVPSARDIGLHIVVTRRVAGASRGLYEPFLLALRESGASGLVLTGDREEGQLFPGVYAQPLPPGRGRWVRRGEPVRLVQTGLDPATPGDRSEAGR
ncbi:type VII secretion protein EccCa [Rugosimonospora africana]|uniref:Type VII secretion protein EccC n=1 Tax=Rugosimonospora africana TaxID=556532 RepID=A0A8J3QV73_9ACTN|nr:type VII secretion protein EccCa [Rugosimonospora africana]GIH17659.1 type VII secretion protein EccC [Rugosimonospora africana]